MNKANGEESLKTDKKKRETKASCWDKMKGYMGFGTALSCQKIGWVFFIPISSNWTFKCQTITVQLIIAAVAFAAFFTFRYVGENRSFNILNEWSTNNFKDLHQKMLKGITYDFEEIVDLEFRYCKK